MAKVDEIKKLKVQLVKLSHDYIRTRDSKVWDIFAGNCCTCGKWCEGSNFQCGHYEPDATGGLLLRYHPHNMHGQGGYCCNINRHGQQRIANEYTMFMIRKYGLPYVEKLRSMKQKTIQGDILFFSTMINLYQIGDENAIVAYLESL